MSTTEPTTYECTHDRVAGGVCIDCRQPVVALCPYCGAGRTRDGEAVSPPPATPTPCAICGEPYPWIIV
jgi:hypothetical protein